MGHRDIKWTSAVGKMALIELLGTGLIQPSICKKTQYLRSTIKGSEINCGMFVCVLRIAKQDQKNFGVCNLCEATVPSHRLI